MIVKIQRPLMYMNEGPTALIYNEDRSYVDQPDWSEMFEQLFEDCELKVYWNAEIVDETLVFLNKVKPREW
jgi:hypothetical protein